MYHSMTKIIFGTANIFYFICVSFCWTFSYSLIFAYFIPIKFLYFQDKFLFCSYIFWGEIPIFLYFFGLVLLDTLKSPTIDAIQRKLQHTINRLKEWTLKNGFTISKNKTVAMHFCPDKKCMDPVLNLDNDPIQFVKEAKFLGLIWDTKLTFEPHIKYLKARCQKSLNILKVLSRTEWGADRTTLLKLYRSLVRSKLDFGCIVYGSASKTALAKLDPVHNHQHWSISLFTCWKPVCWSPWTSIRNSQRKVSSTVHHQTKSQSRKSSLWCCVQSQIPGSV